MSSTYNLCHQHHKSITDIKGYIDVGDGCWRPNVLVTSLRCWWPIQDVGDRFRMLVTDLMHWENHQHNEKVTNIIVLPPTSEISHHHKVIKITMSPTSLSPHTVATDSCAPCLLLDSNRSPQSNWFQSNWSWWFNITPRKKLIIKMSWKLKYVWNVDILVFCGYFHIKN